MRCHYCDRAAAITAESEGIRVGLCEVHFREQLGELADRDLAALEERIDRE